MITERHWDPEDASGTVREKVWEEGKLVADVATETKDPKIAKTYSSVTKLDATCAPSEQLTADDAALDAESAAVVNALIGYFTEQV